MTVLNLITGIATGFLALAALSLIVNPAAHTSDVVKSLADGFSSNIDAAKKF